MSEVMDCYMARCGPRQPAARHRGGGGAAILVLMVTNQMNQPVHPSLGGKLRRRPVLA
jgi:hypothetical protein